MSNAQSTITLQIGNLDADTKEYPLTLFLHGEKGLEEKALLGIPQGNLDRSKFTDDPVKRILQDRDENIVFERIGEELYALLHQGKVGDEWDNLDDSNLRILLDIKPEEIALYPWELVFDGKNRLACTGSFIRFASQKNAPADIASLPLRILIVVGAEEDDEAVSASEEIRRIKTEIRKYERANENNRLVHRIIDIEILPRPNLTELAEKYEEFKPHIFHFIGHGGFDSHNRACLIISAQDPADKAKIKDIKWTTQMISQNFKKWKLLPRMVFINACRSANVKQDQETTQKQAWSIGDGFRSLGIPAVLTMQADIDGKSAGVFGGAFYKSLAELKPLDMALADARSEVVDFLNTVDRRDWAVPVMTIALMPEEILPPMGNISDDILTQIKDCQIFKDIEYFSDRQAERRTLIRGFYPLPPQIANKDLIIVKGKKETGKSWLGRWCMEVCALLNHDIRYVEVGGLESRTWLDVLLQIRDGNDSKSGSLLIHRELRKSAFDKFNWELKHRFKGDEPPIWDGFPVKPEKFKVADPQANWTPTYVEKTFESFRQAIVQASETDKPLIIVLDHFIKPLGITEADMKLLITHLIEPIARGELREKISENESRTVKFVLIFTEEEFKLFNIEGSISSSHDVSTSSLTTDTFVELFSEYIQYRKPDWSESDQENCINFTTTMVTKNPNLPLKEYFNKFEEILELINP